MNTRFNKNQAVAKEPEVIEPKVLHKEESKSKKKVHQLIAAQEYTGPIPPAEEFAKYGQVIENAPERILKVFEEDSQHVREMQKTALDGEVARDKRGQWMAFTVLMSLFCVIVYSLYLGNVTFAGIAGLAFIAMAASSFLKKE